MFKFSSDDDIRIFVVSYRINTMKIPEYISLLFSSRLSPTFGKNRVIYNNIGACVP